MALDVKRLFSVRAGVAFREARGFLELDVAALLIPDVNEVVVHRRSSTKRQHRSRGAEQIVDHLLCIRPATR